MKDPFSVPGAWDAVFEPPARAALEARLPAYIAARRWFRGKSRAIAAATLALVVPLPARADEATGATGRAGPPLLVIAVVRVAYAEGDTDDYALPLTFAAGDDARAMEAARPHLVVAELEAAGVDGVLCDALGDARALASLLDLTLGGVCVRGEGYALRFRRLAAPGAATAPPPASVAPRAVDVEQTNTSIVYGDAYILKVVRRLDEGTSADLEMGELLTAAGYAHAPAVAGAAELVRDGRPPATLAILHRFVANQGDAWAFVLDVIARFLDRVAEGAVALPAASGAPLDLHARAAAPLLPEVEALLADGGSRVRLLAGRVAEMHLALAAPRPTAIDPETFTRFAGEPLDTDERARLVVAARASLGRAFVTLGARLARADALPTDAKAIVGALLPRKAELEARLERFVDLGGAAVPPLKTRVHGDLHLGQVLFTGEDFVIIDFEGEPARPLAERTAKRSPLADVAGMLRSLHYASVSAQRARPRPSADLARAAAAWHDAASAAFLGAYLARARRGPEPAPFLPDDAAALRVMLDFYLLEKCIYELHYEIDNRPDWVAIPAAGLAQLLEEPDAR